MKRLSELIDTWWDVNVGIAVAAIAAITGINRYMVGCKYRI